MRILFLSLILAAYVGNHYAPRFIQQLDDYKKSSACIKSKINDGYARGEIEVIGDTCNVKGK